MRRTVWTLAPLVLLLGACVPDVDISRDTTLSGHVTARTFRVRPGVVVLVDDDLTVDSQGPATIEGELRGEIGSGAAIEIRVSSGDCLVSARVEGGSGSDGEDPGEDGDAGGGVLLRADHGAVRVHGTIEGGDGGEGAGRLEQGRGDIRAVSGAGGAGGDVELAGRVVEISSGATAGDGGAGGAAFAQVFDLAPGAPNIVDSGESRADEEEDGFDDSPLPLTGSAQAVSRAGGNGGSISIRSSDPGGELLFGPAVALRAGSGGATSRASARGGRVSSAELEKPGAGGDVSVRWSDPKEAPRASDWIPGPGGDSGLLGAISAFARAHDSASAKTAGGGDPGKSFLGSDIVKTGLGGDSCNVSAETDSDAKYDFGEAGSQWTPGRPAAAHAP